MRIANTKADGQVAFYRIVEFIEDSFLNDPNFDYSCIILSRSLILDALIKKKEENSNQFKDVIAWNYDNFCLNVQYYGEDMQYVFFLAVDSFFINLNLYCLLETEIKNKYKLICEKCPKD